MQNFAETTDFNNYSSLFERIHYCHSTIDLLIIEIFANNLSAAKLICRRNNQRIIELYAVFFLYIHCPPNKVNRHINCEQLNKAVKHRIDFPLCPLCLFVHRVAEFLQHLCRDNSIMVDFKGMSYKVNGYCPFARI